MSWTHRYSLLLEIHGVTPYIGVVCMALMAKNGISLRQGNRNWITTWNGLILCGSKCDCVHLKSLM